MKKFVCLTISLAVALCAATSAVTAYADGQAAPTVYPSDKFTETISFSSLTDYAVGDSGYAFIDGGELVTVIGGEKKDDYQVTPEAVDYIDGAFICEDGNGAVYSLPDLQELDGVQIAEPVNPLHIKGDGEYKLLDGGELYFCPESSADYVKVAGDCAFSVLKSYSGSVYAVGSHAQGNDNLYIIEQTQANVIDGELIYIDYAASHSISVGTAADETDESSVFNLNSESLHFVTLVEGYFMTAIDLQTSPLSDSTYFAVNSAVGTFKVGDADRPKAGDTALLLCQTGNASVVAIGAQAYVMPTDGVIAAQVTGVSSPPASNLKGSVVLPACNVFASPYISSSTAKDELTAGATVTVTEIIEYPDVLACDVFYKIEYVGSDGRTETGYVPEGYFSPYVYAGENPTEIPDPDPDDGDYISTVVIVLIIIALVLIAVGYLVYVSTAGKKKKQNQSKEEKD